MKKLMLSGDVGWDITPGNLREMLGDETDDLDIHLTTPGGSVYDALAIYNILKNYPGQVTVTISGLVASAGTYIAMAANKIKVEDNAIFMIHDITAGVYGSFRTFEKLAKVLRSYTGIMINEYRKRTKKSKSELDAMLAEETYMFGEEIIEHGFADEVVLAGDGAANKEEAVENAHRLVMETANKLKPLNSDSVEAFTQETTKLVASVSTTKMVDKPETANESLDNKVSTANSIAEPNESNFSNREKESMTEQELKEKHPELYGSLVAQGVKRENERLASFDGWLEANPDNAEMQKFIAKVKDEGKSANDCLPQLIKLANETKQPFNGSNPPEINSSNPGSSGLGVENLTEEGLKMCAEMGIDPKAFKQALGEVDKEEVE